MELLAAEAARWVGATYHERWHVSEALEKGIGVHHGRVPRALGQYMVSAFNRDVLKFLVCTSTLIEGVNTKAKNVIIYDDKINRSHIDFFTFNNIKGRSGRMGKHFVGHVYLFHSPPEEELPFVDILAFSQPEQTPESLLIQMDDSDLTELSRSRLERFRQSPILTYDTLKANIGIDPGRQLALAGEIRQNPRGWWPSLNWTAVPTKAQVLAVSSLIWKHFNGIKLGSASARSAEQLALMINSLRSAPTTRHLIDEAYAYHHDADTAVQQVLDFLRLWANFHYPRLLRAVDRIQREIFTRMGLRTGNYDFFANRVENYFLDTNVVALDDYGVPLEIGRKLQSALDFGGDLDEVLERLKTVDLESAPVSRFERKLVREAQEYL